MKNEDSHSNSDSSGMSTEEDLYTGLNLKPQYLMDDYQELLQKAVQHDDGHSSREMQRQNFYKSELGHGGMAVSMENRADFP